MGKNILFITNNSSKSRAMYAKNFTRLGIDVDEGELYPSVRRPRPSRRPPQRPGSLTAACGTWLARYPRDSLQSYCAARFIQRKLPHVRKAFVIGGAGLADELELAGIRTVSYTSGTEGLGTIGAHAAFPSVRRP